MALFRCIFHLEATSFHLLAKGSHLLLMFRSEALPRLRLTSPPPLSCKPSAQNASLDAPRRPAPHFCTLRSRLARSSHPRGCSPHGRPASAHGERPPRSQRQLKGSVLGTSRSRAIGAQRQGWRLHHWNLVTPAGAVGDAPGRRRSGAAAKPHRRGKMTRVSTRTERNDNQVRLSKTDCLVPSG